MVAPVPATVFEAQNKSRLCRWLGKCYIGREKLVTLSARGGVVFDALCAYSKKKAISAAEIRGAYFRYM